MAFIQPLDRDDSTSRADVGFLLVGHGTRNQAGQKQFETVFQDFQSYLQPSACELAFLELATPDIPAAVRKLTQRGVRRIVTVPVLLFSAGHAQQDIPLAVQDAAQAAGASVITQTPPLETDPAILQLSARRFREAVCVLSNSVADRNQQATKPPNGNDPADRLAGDSTDLPLPCRDTCHGQFCSKLVLTMVGRGSRSGPATERMRRFTALRCELTPVAFSLTAFIHAQTPNVEAALDEMQLSNHEIKVVQPHLLFEGELVEQLRVQVAARQARDPSKRWIVTHVLGADHELAKTLAAMAKLAMTAV